jgi:hypothetical protein
MEAMSDTLFIGTLFVGLWLTVGGLLAVGSGWVQLARRYRSTSRPSGLDLGFPVRRVGWVVENHVTRLCVVPEGLYLSALFLFRFLRPPLLVPWTDVHVGSMSRLFWRAGVTLDLGHVTTIRVSSDAYALIKSHLGSQAMPPN